LGTIGLSFPIDCLMTAATARVGTVHMDQKHNSGLGLGRTLAANGLFDRVPSTILSDVLSSVPRIQAHEPCAHKFQRSYAMIK
jgi:hypothetical protein